MVINRIIDNAAVAVASWNRSAVITAREMTLSPSATKEHSIYGY